MQRNIQGIETLRVKAVQKANQAQETLERCLMRHEEMQRKADLDERTVAVREKNEKAKHKDYLSTVLFRNRRLKQ